MTAPEQLIFNAKAGSKLPPREPLYEEPEVLDNVPVARLGKEAIIQNSEARPVTPYYSDISLELAAGFNATLAGDTPPEQAVKSLQEEIQSIVEQGEQA
jgi:multiple sugar transport system substrate-binding protein